MIIVTRPSPYGEELVKQLTQAGIRAKHYPLFSIQAGCELQQLVAKIEQLRAGDIVIVASPQVLNILSKTSLSVNFPDHLHYMTVGAGTAKLLAQFTSTPIIYPTDSEDSEGLLSRSELSQVEGKRVLILRGNIGRELLSQTLQSRGATVEYCECYQRVPVVYSPSDITSWEKSSTIIVTSLESLLALEQCITPEQRTSCTLIISSPRIASKAQQLGWSHCLLSNSASNQILFKTIMTLCHNELNNNI